MGRSTEICGAGEYVAIGRSMGIGRDQEIAPTEERSAVSGQEESRSGDRSYRIAVSDQRSAVSGQEEESRSGDRSYSPFYFFIEKTTKIGGLPCCGGLCLVAIVV